MFMKLFSLKNSILNGMHILSLQKDSEINIEFLLHKYYSRKINGCKRHQNNNNNKNNKNNPINIIILDHKFFITKNFSNDT